MIVAGQRRCAGARAAPDLADQHIQNAIEDKAMAKRCYCCGDKIKERSVCPRCYESLSLADVVELAKIPPSLMMFRIKV